MGLTGDTRSVTDPRSLCDYLSVSNLAPFTLFHQTRVSSWSFVLKKGTLGDPAGEVGMGIHIVPLLEALILSEFKHTVGERNGSRTINWRDSESKE